MASTAARSDRIAIVDDHVSIAEALVLALGGQGRDVQRVAVPNAPAPPVEMVGKILALDPTVVLLDLGLGPYGDGILLIAPLATAGTDVVVLTGQTDQVRWGEALARGARAVLSKSQPLDDINATVRRLGQGQPVLDPAERDVLIAAWSSQHSAHSGIEQRLALLTGREREVLADLMRGRAVREIASRGGVSEATVRTQVKSILSKLGVSSQLAAVGLAHEVGFRRDR